MKKVFTLIIATIGLFSCSQVATEEVTTEVEAAPSNKVDTNLMTDEDSYSDNGVEYEPLTEDPFEGYENANLIIDYFVTEGWSTNDRHSYEIIVIDDQIMFGFGSPQSDSHREVHYEKKETLSPADVKEIASLLKKANIKQVRTGIPKPDASAHKKEVLLVRNGSQRIAGGMFSYVVYEDGTSEEEIDKQIAETRRETASISGNYDMLFDNLRKRFTNLDSLITASVSQE
ncbi:hypothetical protein [Pontibacter ruber]|uniref:Uncharacterized protein n=1 Tax=Pontibacter ruber TaxID=1343895 RepID=A0ABW5CYC2_9BACT|nr:hypothetical protein [Pontibacter ruber]